MQIENEVEEIENLNYKYLALNLYCTRIKFTVCPTADHQPCTFRIGLP